MPVFSSSPHHAAYRDEHSHQPPFYAHPAAQSAYHAAASAEVAGRRASHSHFPHHALPTALPATSASASSFPLYPSHHPLSSPTQTASSPPSASAAYNGHPLYGRGYPFPAASEPPSSRSDIVTEAGLELDQSAYRGEASRHKHDEQQLAYVAHAVHVTSSSPAPLHSRPAVKRQLSGPELSHPLHTHTHMQHQQREAPQHLLSHQAAMQQHQQHQHHGRQESPLSNGSVHSGLLSSSPLPFTRSASHSTAHDAHAQQPIAFSPPHAVALKQEALSPLRDDLSGVSSPSHDSTSSSSSSSSASSSCSSTSSGSSSVESPYPLPRNLPVSRDVLCRLPFSFIVHLRVDDRTYLPRSIVTPLTVSISQLLHIATNISAFVAVHSTASPPITEDASILCIPAVADRLRDRATRLLHTNNNGTTQDTSDALPLFKPSPPVLLPRNTPLAFTVPPPLRAGVPTGGKRSRNMEDGDDDEDEEMLDSSGSGSGAREREVGAEAADLFSIHLLFDLAQDVKACTRLGCVNMLVKKSSRRSCDDCQNNGYQLPTESILKFTTPQDSQAPFSRLSAADQASVRGQLNAAITAAVDKLEYWKFELPEDDAYLYAFVSVGSARQAFDHFHQMLRADKSQPGPPLISPLSAPAVRGVRDVAGGDSSTDSEPSVNSASRSGSSGGSDDPSLSDSEVDPAVPRRQRKNSASHSSNSNSSVDMLGRSTASTSSNSSASINNSPRTTDSDPLSPTSSHHNAVPVLSALTGLLPSYPYVAHLRGVDAESGVYSLKMKSHFWKLEVRPHANAPQHKGKAPRVKIYKKVGAKRPAEKVPINKRPAATTAAARASISKHSTTIIAPQPAKSRPLTQLAVTTPAPEQLQLSYTSSPVEQHQQPHSDWSMQPSVPTSMPIALASHPLADSFYAASTRKRGGSDAESKAGGFTYTPQRSPASTSSHLPPLFSTAPTSSHHYNSHNTLEPVDPTPQFDYDMTLPPHFHAGTDDDLPQLPADPVDSFLSAGYHTGEAAVVHNSVLVSRRDHEYLLKQKPIGATLSVHTAHGGEAGYDGHEARVGVAAPTPVLLVYRDHQQYVRDVNHGFLTDRDGGGGGAGRDGWGGGGGGGGHEDRKDGPGDHRRHGGGGGGGGGDDFDAHNGKRRRIDHHQLARDAVPSTSAPSSAGDGGDDKKKSLLQDDWQQPWKYPGSVAPTTPPSKLAVLLSSQQASNIWLLLLVALSVIGIVLLTYNLRSTGDTLRIVSMVRDDGLSALQGRTTMSSAANLFSQMRVASPVFNSWVQAKASGSSRLYLADDDGDTDIVYPLSSKQFDLLPGSVIGSYAVGNVQSSAAWTPEQWRTTAQLNYSEVIQRCQQSTNTAKAVGDFLVSANALGQDFAYHFLGTPLSVLNRTVDSIGNTTSTGLGSGSSASSTGAAGRSSSSSSSTGQATYNDATSSSSSTGGYSSDSSGAGDSSWQDGGATIAEYILDYESSTLSSPPKPAATCALIFHEVGMAFIRQFLCKAVANLDSPHAPLLMHQCHKQEHFNCTEFIWTIFSSNLTNSVFAIETQSYATDALLIALHYHQQAAVLAPTCASFDIMTHDQLDGLQSMATVASVNVGVLVGVVMGGAALMVVGLGLAAVAVAWVVRAREEKARVLAAEEAASERRKLAVDEKEKRDREALGVDVEDADGGIGVNGGGGDVSSELRDAGVGSRSRRSLSGPEAGIEMH